MATLPYQPTDTHRTSPLDTPCPLAHNSTYVENGQRGLAAKGTSGAKGRQGGAFGNTGRGPGGVCQGRGGAWQCSRHSKGGAVRPQPALLPF